jgi:hypothetical protein
MKGMKFKTLLIVSMALCLLVSACGAGFLASVPWIRNATCNDVVNLGDSIFALSGEESDYLHSWSGQTFRRYAVSGAEIAGGILAPDVGSQYATAKSDNSNIKTIIMDGGGNDILIPAAMFDPYNCKVDWWEWGRLSSKCKRLINDVYVDTVNVLNQMGRDGVDNIIFQGYYTPKFGLIGTTKLKKAVDYGDYKLAQAVNNATAANNYRVFLDPRPYFSNSDIIIDGIHPTKSGSKKLATLVWAELGPLL